MALITNLISYYKLDEASGVIIDAHGTNDGTYDGALYNQAGKINSSIGFNGSSNEIGLGNINPVTGATGSFGGWINTNDLTVGTVIRKRGAEYLIDLQSGSLFRFFAGGVQVTGGTVTTNTWFHIIGVKNGGTIELYINGVSVGTNTGSSDILSNSDPLEIGGNAGLGGYWDGELDEIGIWSRALSAAEVTDLYNSGSGLAYPFITTIQKTSLGNARIQVAANQITKTGTARLQINNKERVYDSVARINVQSQITKTGNSRIEVLGLQKTSTGTARINIQKPITKTGTARLQILATQKTSLGNAFISTVKTLDKIGNATVQVLKLQKTSLGNARIQIIDNKKTSLGNARINIQSQITKTGTARIKIISQITKTGNARLQTQQSILKTGNACIQAQIQITKLGNAFISTAKSITKTGNAFISVVDEFKPVVKSINSTKPTFRSAETFN